MKNIVLTGPPRIGKTTIIKQVVRATPGCRGFYTEELKKKNQRIGFKLVTITGNECILAHKDTQSKYRIGKYGVVLECIERVGIPALQQGIREQRLIVIDEIGKMELFSKQFQDVVLEALDSRSNVLGTMFFGAHPFCTMVRHRNDVEIIEVTVANRADLPDRIIATLTP